MSWNGNLFTATTVLFWLLFWNYGFRLPPTILYTLHDWNRSMGEGERESKRDVREANLLRCLLQTVWARNRKKAKTPNKHEIQLHCFIKTVVQNKNAANSNIALCISTAFFFVCLAVQITEFNGVREKEKKAKKKIRIMQTWFCVALKASNTN